MSTWTEEEDDKLRRLVDEHGVKKWAFIATVMVSKGSKPCRRRWKNFLSADLKKGDWTPQEDAMLLQGHSRYGNKWTEIAKMVGGRTDNAVKNRWSALMKKSPGVNGSSAGMPLAAAPAATQQRRKESEDSEEVVAMTDTDYDSAQDDAPDAKKLCVEVRQQPQQRAGAELAVSPPEGGDGKMMAEASVRPALWAVSSAPMHRQHEPMSGRHQGQWAPQHPHAPPALQPPHADQQQQPVQAIARQELSIGQGEQTPWPQACRPMLDAALECSNSQRPQHESQRAQLILRAECAASKLGECMPTDVTCATANPVASDHLAPQQRAQQPQQQQQQQQTTAFQHHRQPQQQVPQPASTNCSQHQLDVCQQNHGHRELQVQQQQCEHLYLRQIELQVRQLQQLQQLQEQQHREQLQRLQEQQHREQHHLRELINLQLQQYQRAMQDRVGGGSDALQQLGGAPGAAVKSVAASAGAHLSLLAVLPLVASGARHWALGEENAAKPNGQLALEAVAGRLTDALVGREERGTVTAHFQATGASGCKEAPAARPSHPTLLSRAACGGAELSSSLGQPGDGRGPEGHQERGNGAAGSRDAGRGRSQAGRGHAMPVVNLAPACGHASIVDLMAHGYQSPAGASEH